MGSHQSDVNCVCEFPYLGPHRMNDLSGFEVESVLDDDEWNSWKAEQKALKTDRQMALFPL